MMTNQQNKFRGGLRIGLYSNSWPNGVLKVNENSLILHDESTKKEYEFLKNNIDKIRVKKIFPVIGYGIRIYHNKNDYKDKIYFWYVGFNFSKLTKSLKSFGWL